MILRADKNLLGNMLIIAQGRKLNIENVLAHHLGPILGTLANLDGSLQNKTQSLNLNVSWRRTLYHSSH